MEWEEFLKKTKKTIAKYPQYKSDIIDLVYLAKDEIEDGESPTHEIEKALYSITELCETGSY